MLESAAPEAIIAFTDGGCKGNPGPAGSGALVTFPDGRRAESSRSLGHGTNNIAELTAIGMALDILDEAGVPAETPVLLLSDSSYANGVLCRGWKAKANRELILSLRERLGERPGVTIQWVAGHAGIEGNERADALANAGIDGVTDVKWREISSE
ncbi:MAG: reverse transcriptase-like protein [Proteobacteria bacterium]|nr:reverse transcriptase-like protein [Pseudomonadota bacterium]